MERRIFRFYSFLRGIRSAARSPDVEAHRAKLATFTNTDTSLLARTIVAGTIHRVVGHQQGIQSLHLFTRTQILTHT